MQTTRSRSLISRVRAREAFRHTLASGGFGGYVTQVRWVDGSGWVATLDGAGAGFSVYSRCRRLTRRLSVITL